MATVSSSHSGSYNANSRERPRRCASALGDSAWPHSATVRRRRVAVSTSCSALAARVAINTSPTAVMRRWVAAATAFTRSRTSSSSPCINKGIASQARSMPIQALSHCACANSDSNDKAVEGRGGGNGLATLLATFLATLLAMACEASLGGLGGSSGPSPLGPSRASRVSRPRGRPAPGEFDAIAAAALACAAAITLMPDSWALTGAAPVGDWTLSAGRPARPDPAPSPAPADAVEVAQPPAPPGSRAPSGTGPAVGNSSTRQSGRPARCGSVGARPSRSLVRAS